LAASKNEKLPAEMEKIKRYLAEKGEG